jgi:hypothetical protein
MKAMVEENVGQSIGYFLITDGGPTSLWDVGKGEILFGWCFMK